MAYTSYRSYSTQMMPNIVAEREADRDGGETYYLRCNGGTLTITSTTVYNRIVVISWDYKLSNMPLSVMAWSQGRVTIRIGSRSTRFSKEKKKRVWIIYNILFIIYYTFCSYLKRQPRRAEGTGFPLFFPYRCTYIIPLYYVIIFPFSIFITNII